MNIIISNSSDKPIYEQIVSQVKQLIISNHLAAGELLPSMRVLAKELRISVITTKRAYEELERMGFITTVPGKGSFVASGNLESIKEEQLRELEQGMEKVVEMALAIGLNWQDIVELLEIIYHQQES